VDELGTRESLSEPCPAARTNFIRGNSDYSYPSITDGKKKQAEKGSIFLYYGKKITKPFSLKNGDQCFHFAADKCGLNLEKKRPKRKQKKLKLKIKINIMRSTSRNKIKLGSQSDFQIMAEAHLIHNESWVLSKIYQ